MSHIFTGKEGEKLAAEWLEQKGYTVLERNWRYEKLEIDLIVRKKELIIFAEVKSRTGVQFGFPEEAVSEAKQRRLADAAEAYLETLKAEFDIRFDIISVIFHPSKPTEVYHIQDAFFPIG